MKALSRKLSITTMQLKDPFYFQESEKEIYTILESHEHLCCQMKYLISYLTYIQMHMLDRFSGDNSRITTMILIIDSIFKMGFRSYGMQFSDSCSISSKSQSDCACDNGFKTEALELVTQECSSVLREFPKVEISGEAIKKLEDTVHIYHYWHLIEILFSDHPAIKFIVHNYQRKESMDEKALAL